MLQTYLKWLHYQNGCRLSPVYLEIYEDYKEHKKGSVCSAPQESKTDPLACQKYAFPVLFHAMESYHISAEGLCPHQKHDVMASAIVRATLPFYEPIWDQGNSRRLKESAKEPSLCGHNRSSCKAFGKSVTTKEHSGLSQAPALCPLAVKGKGICLACKLAKTLAMTLGGVWEKGERTSSRGDDDDTPRPSPQNNFALNGAKV